MPPASAETEAAAAGAKTARGRFRRVYNSRPNVDFRKIWPRTFLISAAVLIIAGSAWGIRGLNLGIEFEGGTVWEFSSPSTSIGEIRNTLRPFGQGDARIQSLGGNSYRIRAEVNVENSQQALEISRALADSADIEAADVSFSAVGPSWGDEITNRARLALLVFLGVVTVYIWVRLEWRMTLAALVALGHDILVTVGVYALFQLEVTPATLIAFLTILGYSLYDTLVVFDKIRENESRRHQMGYTDLVSSSMNQVLMRSVNTTLTSVVPVAALLIIGRFFLGAVTLAEFAIALLVGLLAGTYSSIFVATPLVARLKDGFRSGLKGGQKTGEEQRAETPDRDKDKATDKSKAKDSEKPGEPDPSGTPGRARKGMLAKSRVTTTPQTIPRPRKKKRRN